MTQQNADYPLDYSKGSADAGKEGLTQIARDLGERTEEVMNDVASTVKEHPLATLAIAAGLAFAIGALWKLRTPARQSQVEALLDRLPKAERIRSMWR
jgi:DUF883 C-terminal glycine zipper region